MIEDISTIIREKSLVNQWKDTDRVINWFKNIDNKSKCIFMQIEIEEFYPSSLKDLLMKAVNHAKSLLLSVKKEVNTVMHSLIQ